MSMSNPLLRSILSKTTAACARTPATTRSYWQEVLKIRTDRQTGKKVAEDAEKMMMRAEFAQKAEGTILMFYIVCIGKCHCPIHTHTHMSIDSFIFVCPYSHIYIF